MSNKPKYKGIFDYEQKPVVKDNTPSKTRQSFKDECDINKIVERYRVTGMLTDPSIPKTRNPFFGDFTQVTDYHQQAAQIASLNAEFEALPAKIRSRFQNDPGQMLDFLADEANTEEAVKLGLKPMSALPKDTTPTTEPPAPTTPEEPAA